jgi:hypothetical protein
VDEPDPLTAADEQAWLALKGEARVRLVAAHRSVHLHQQSEAWSQADRLRRYCDAMEAAYGEHADSTQWIAWARAHAAELDRSPVRCGRRVTTARGTSW